MNFSQNFILKNFEEYMACKQAKSSTEFERHNYQLPFETLQGLCSGLVALWLYYKRMDQEFEFILMLEYIQAWNTKDFDGEDPVFEAAINDIAFLHFNYKLLESQNQSDLDQGFSIISSKHQPQLATEFNLTWVFDGLSLQTLLDEMLQPNKLVRVSDGLHVVGCINAKDGMYFYDPNASSGPILCGSIVELNNHIFEALPLGRDDDNYIALHINCYDLLNDNTPLVISKDKYYDRLSTELSFRQKLLHNPNIFHLAVRYSDMQALKTLFQEKYVYIPWKFTNTCELSEVVERNDQTMLGYLLSKSIPLDYRAPHGITPIATAIWQNNFEMLYLLVQHGANINAKAHDFKTAINIACMHKNSTSIVFLLACGYNISQEEIQDVNLIFKKQAPTIFKNALKLHQVLAEISIPFVLTGQTYKNIISFLTHCLLQQKLFGNLVDIEAIHNNDKYYQASIPKIIIEYMHSKKLKNLLEYAEVSQIYHLLENLKIGNLISANQNELLVLFKTIFFEIAKKPLKKHNFDDLVEIKSIISNLHHLANARHNKEISERAKLVIKYIGEYFSKNGVGNMEEYFQQNILQEVEKLEPLLYLSSQSIKPVNIDLEEAKRYIRLNL